MQKVGPSVVAADNGATKGLSNGISEEGDKVRLLFRRMRWQWRHLDLWGLMNQKMVSMWVGASTGMAIRAAVKGKRSALLS